MGVQLIKTKMRWELFSPTCNFILNMVATSKLKAKILTFSSSNFKGVKICLHLELSCRVLVHFLFAFGVFKVMYDIILLAFGTCLFQIVNYRACE
jgi:hypothetical protein